MNYDEQDQAEWQGTEAHWGGERTRIPQCKRNVEKDGKTREWATYEERQPHSMNRKGNDGGGVPKEERTRDCKKEQTKTCKGGASKNKRETNTKLM